MYNSTLPSFAIQGMSMNDAGLMYIFGYVPSLTAATTMTIIYAFIVCITLFMSNMVRMRGAGHRSTCCCGCLRCCFGNIKICHYTSVLPAAAILELFGYGMRRDMILEFGAWSYLFATISILIAPVILAIMNYKVVVRLLDVAQIYIWGLSPKMLGSIIVFVDVTCAVLQFGGGVCQTLAIAMHLQLLIDLSDYLLLSAFLLQLMLNFAFTMLIRWMYVQPLFAPPTSPVPQVTKFWTTMWSTVGLLWIRNLYRALDAFVVIGRSNALAKESLFYALDTAPVVLCFLIFIWGHYGILLPPEDNKLQLMTNLEVIDVDNINNGTIQPSLRPQSVIPVQEIVPSAIHVQMVPEEEV